MAFNSSQELLDQESAELEERVRHEQAAPDELTGVFTGTLKCDNASCQRVAAMSGDWRYVWGYSESLGTVLYDDYAVRYINPAPRLLLTPAKTPIPVVEAVALASQLLWSSPDAAASQLRRAVEELLTSLRVKRFELTSKKGGKKRTRRRLDAHARIKMLPAKHAHLADTLMAVKWIGNTGTHESGLTVRDVEDGAALLQLALQRLYDTSIDELLAKAGRINLRKGLPRKR
ncbi:DUF4145 domain-containing protein [Rathayibacter sp. VKM Ac-2927]|uniref:DUF4145 domain-containing protein n=1 Tax=Rathayibacter sp. VKM Ac-2927 TaxID=2929478 RepID=UPI001FB2808F|nr:DUF4145 domain-containing protein [Rathayibacter sp. VKM Ac-2927]